MCLKQLIEKWDKKSASVVNDIYDKYKNSDSFINDLIVFLEHQSLQIGASWLLKKHLENGAVLGSCESSQFHDCLDKLNDWESKLHALQCLPLTHIHKSKKNEFEAFLRCCLVDSNKFVRAWTYNGFYEFSKQYKEYQKEVQELLNIAMREESASVKARVRSCLAEGFQ